MQYESEIDNNNEEINNEFIVNKRTKLNEIEISNELHTNNTNNNNNNTNNNHNNNNVDNIDNISKNNDNIINNNINNLLKHKVHKNKSKTALKPLKNTDNIDNITKQLNIKNLNTNQVSIIKNSLRLISKPNKFNHNVNNNYGTSNVIRVSKRIQNQNKRIKQPQYAYKAVDAVISIEEALSSSRRKEWIDAINKELLSHRINGTWELSEVDENHQTKFVLRPKFDENGNEIKLKARLVILGFKELYGIDYEETFAPVTKLTSLRIFLCIAVQFNMTMIQLDVVTAFLNADLPETIFIDIPFGVDIEEELSYLPLSHRLNNIYKNNPNKIKLKLRKSIYGLKQAPRNWYNNINSYLKSIGFQPIKSDPCIYYKNTIDSRCILTVQIIIS